MRQALTNESGTGVSTRSILPVIGIGLDNHRILCPKISAGNPDVDCHTHPHNFYIQLLGETGLIGLALGVAMVVSIIWACLRANLANRRDVLAATCFVVPLGCSSWRNCRFLRAMEQHLHVERHCVCPCRLIRHRAQNMSEIRSQSAKLVFRQNGLLAFLI